MDDILELRINLDYLQHPSKLVSVILMRL